MKRLLRTPRHWKTRQFWINWAKPIDLVNAPKRKPPQGGFFFDGKLFKLLGISRFGMPGMTPAFGWAYATG
jgi:hypothetical protein